MTLPTSLTPGSLASALPILTILNDPSRSAMYRHLSQQAGVPTIEAQGALHALTQLERTPVAAIICDAEMEDMTGEDFREVVAAESHSQDVPVYVLPPLPGSGQPQPDAEQQLTAPQLLSRVLTDLGLSPARFPVPLQPDIAPHLHGDLSQFSLPEFLNWVAEMRFSGHWLVTVSSRQGAAHPLTGHLAMQGGHLVYAECNGQTGKAALFTLLRAIEVYRDAIFRFYRSDVPAEVRARDLQTTTPRLLIELAVELDHYAAGHAPPGHGAAARSPK
ncbi:DUF4388 domain-containing protein [Deinococcus sp. VB343]|uniref:DUF4388 domain-containing protein n=1 Tax=Deinococcus sp. VB142 TaxID=3112952 RepID=A0AAU6Q5X5_9DEIO